MNPSIPMVDIHPQDKELKPIGHSSWRACPHDTLNFGHLRVVNVARCNEVFHPLESWTPTDWATAMAGECGEACNLIKKLRRGEQISLFEVAKELADMIIYADLLSARLGIDLGSAVRNKFNEVSTKRGARTRLPEQE